MVIYIVALRIDAGPVVENVVIFYQDVLAQAIQSNAVILPTVSPVNPDIELFLMVMLLMPPVQSVALGP